MSFSVVQFGSAVMCATVSVNYRRVTDRQTDRRTEGHRPNHSIYCASR